MSEWDRTCGFADAREALAARMREDEDALRGLDVERSYLDLLDAAYLPSGRPESDRDVLRGAVRAWVTEHAVDGGRVVVAAPAGAGITIQPSGMPRGPGPRRRMHRLVAWVLGGPGRRMAHRLFVRRKAAAQRQGMLAHADHLFVRDAACEAVLGRDDVSLVLYEELPYLWSRPADDEVAAVAARHGATTEEVRLDVDIRDKAERVACYRSQLAALDPELGRLSRPDALPRQERYWRLGWRVPEA